MPESLQETAFEFSVHVILVLLIQRKEMQVNKCLDKFCTKDSDF